MRKKIIHISQGFYRFRFLLHRYYFSISLTNCIYLVGYAKRMLYFEQPTVLLARNHLNTMLLTNFEHLIFISNIFQFRTFLSFDGPSNYLYLFKKHRQTFPGSEERPSSHLKVTKMWFGPNIKYLSEPFFADFCCREGISYLIRKAPFSSFFQIITTL